MTTFAALGDPTRLSLVRRLGRGSRLNVSQLTSGMGVSRQAVTKHLAVLHEAGIVSRTEAGRQTVYELRGEQLAEASEFLARISAGWDRALERLRAHAEEG